MALSKMCSFDIFSGGGREKEYRLSLPSASLIKVDLKSLLRRNPKRLSPMWSKPTNTQLCRLSSYSRFVWMQDCINLGSIPRAVKYAIMRSLLSLAGGSSSGFFLGGFAV